MQDNRAEIGKSVARAGVEASLAQLDLTKYDFDGFRSDIEAILDIPGAVLRAARWVVGTIVLTAIGTWLALTTNLDGFGLFFVVVLLVLLVVPVAFLIAASLIGQTRLDRTTRAAERAVEMVGLLHRDAEAVRDKGAEVPMRAMGVVVAENVVFPMLSTALDRSAWFGGPLALLARPVAHSLLDASKDRALAMVRELPDAPAALPVATGPADTVSSSEVEIVPSTSVELIDAHYLQLAERASRIVGRAGRFVVTPLRILTLLAVIGWLLLFAVILTIS